MKYHHYNFGYRERREMQEEGGTRGGPYDRNGAAAAGNGRRKAVGGTYATCTASSAEVMSWVYSAAFAVRTAGFKD